MLRSSSSINTATYWDNKLSWASTAFFIGSVANASLKTILPIPDAFWGILSALFGLGIIGVFGLSFKEMLRRSSKLFWQSVILFLFVYFISAVLIVSRGEPLKEMIIGTAFLTFAWWIPSGVFACSVYDKCILYGVWVKASYIISFFALLMYFFHIPDEVNVGGNEYNMTFGFYIIAPLLIQINEFIKKKRLWLLALILFETFTVFVYASRGILLSLIFFVIYKFAFESNSVVKKVFALLIIALMTFIMLSSIQTIASSLMSILDVFGVQSRSIMMLAEGTISDTSGRDEIWTICFNMIEQRPILGWGLGGEYVNLAKVLGGVSASEASATAFNPHNGLIQNFVCFGVLFGLIVNIIVLIPLLNLNKYKDECLHDMILVFTSAALVPMCISASGFFIRPEMALCLYLFYFGNKFKKKPMVNHPVLKAA